MHRCLRGFLFVAAFALSLSVAASDDDAAAAADLPEPTVDDETGVRWYRDVAYVAGDDAHPTKHRLDLFLPAPDKRRNGRPMLIWIHGGGWTMGDKDDAFGLYRRYCRMLAERGVATANVSYRLSPAVKHPAHIEDVAAATAWVIGHAEQLGFDPTTVFVSGHSAGGHLAALVATDHRWLEAHGLSKGSIAGALPSSGVFDVRTLVESNARWERAFAREDAADASPLLHADAADPPFAFVIEGEGAWMQDQTERMAAALEKAGVEQEVVRLPNVNHITMLRDLFSVKGKHLTTALAFIDRVVEQRKARARDEE